MCSSNIDKFIACIFKINDTVARYLERRKIPGRKKKAPSEQIVLNDFP